MPLHTFRSVALQLPSVLLITFTPSVSCAPLSNANEAIFCRFHALLFVLLRPGLVSLTVVALVPGNHCHIKYADFPYSIGVKGILRAVKCTVFKIFLYFIIFEKRFEIILVVNGTDIIAAFSNLSPQAITASGKEEV